MRVEGCDSDSLRWGERKKSSSRGGETHSQEREEARTLK